MKAIIKYPGSKWSLAGWITSLLPEHHSYLEPFFGSGAVLFNKFRSHIETINDMDNTVTNLFECIRRDPEKLARMIYLTPYARETYEGAYRESPEDKFEAAASFCIRLNMGHGFRTNGEKVGWKCDIRGRERSYASLDWCSLPERIIKAAERLRGVQIENRPAAELIPRFNFQDVLIYCDPPYMLETRHGRQYRCEMGDSGHEALLDMLLKHKGYAVISGYDTGLYNNMLSGWNRFEKEVYTQVMSKRKEIIWMNYDPPNRQMSLEDIY